MAKIIQFPGTKREDKNRFTLSIDKMNEREISAHIERLIEFGLTKETALTILHGLYRSKYFTDHSENKITSWFFKIRWEKISKKCA